MFVYENPCEILTWKLKFFTCRYTLRVTVSRNYSTKIVESQDFLVNYSISSEIFICP